MQFPVFDTQPPKNNKKPTMILSVSSCELNSINAFLLPGKERKQPSVRLKRLGKSWSLAYLFSLICCFSFLHQFFKEIMYLST
jgi:hypothetical protein